MASLSVCFCLKRTLTESESPGGRTVEEGRGGSAEVKMSISQTLWSVPFKVTALLFNLHCSSSSSFGDQMSTGRYRHTVRYSTAGRFSRQQPAAAGDDIVQYYISFQRQTAPEPGRTNEQERPPQLRPPFILQDGHRLEIYGLI